MVETLCDKAAVQLKAGANASTLTDAQYTQLINQAESYINMRTRVNWVDIYSTLNDDLKKVLEDACSSRAAMTAIMYDLFAFNSRAEAQTMLDVNITLYTEVINGLKEDYAADFVEEV